MYCYDGIYYAVAIINKKNGDVVGLGGEIVDARVFFLVRVEPCAIMQRLTTQHPFLNSFLPHDTSCIGVRDSKEIVNVS